MNDAEIAEYAIAHQVPISTNLCSCPCLCFSKCFCGSIICSATLTPNRDLNSSDVDLESIISSITIEEYDEILISVNPFVHQFNPDYYKFLQREAKRIILLAHTRLGHRNFTDVIHELKHYNLLTDNMDLKGSFTDSEFSDIFTIIAHTDPDQFTCFDCWGSKITASKRVQVSHREAGRPPMYEGYIDVAGPFPPGPSGERYSFLYRCNNSGTVKMAALQDLDPQRSLIPAVQVWRIEAREKQWTMHKMHADSGSTTRSKSFITTMANMGINMVYAPPGQHYMNGFIETFIRTVVLCTKSMIRAAHLPTKLWPYIMQHACWLSNTLLQRRRKRQPHYQEERPIDIISKKSWTGKWPTPGQAAVSWIPNVNQAPKLEDRGRICAWLCFANDNNYTASYLWHLKTNRIILSRRFKLVGNVYAYNMKPIVPVDQDRVIGSDLDRPMSDIRPISDHDQLDDFPETAKRMRPDEICDYSVDPVTDSMNPPTDPLPTSTLSKIDPPLEPLDDWTNDDTIVLPLPGPRRSARLAHINPDSVAMHSITVMYEYAKFADEYIFESDAHLATTTLEVKHNYVLNIAVTSKYLPHLRYESHLSMEEAISVQKQVANYGNIDGFPLISYAVDMDNIGTENCFDDDVIPNPLTNLADASNLSVSPDVFICPVTLASRQSREKLVDFSDGCGKVTVTIPSNYKTCIENLPANQGFLDALDNHVKMLIELKCLDEVQYTLPSHIDHALSTGWVFDVKTTINDIFTKYKARCVVKGSGQRKGDFGITYAPTCSDEPVRIAIALVITHRWYPIKFDFGNAYKMAKPDRELWAVVPPGYPGFDPKLKKYARILINWEGTKQAGRLFWLHLIPHLQKAGYQTFKSEQGVWFKRNQINGLRTIIPLFVDDGLGATEDPAEREFLFAHLRSNGFTVTTTDAFDRLLGMQVNIKKDGSAVLCNVEYFREVAQELHIDVSKLPYMRIPGHPKYRLLPNTTGSQAKPIITFYQKLCGSFNWAGVKYRPDIKSCVRELSQFNANPSMEHVDKALELLSYLCNTRLWGLKFNAPRGPFNPQLKLNFMAYVDADWAKEWHYRSISGWVIQLLEPDQFEHYKSTGMRINGNFVMYASKKQSDTVADSTKTSESVAIVHAGAPLEFGRNFLSEIDLLSPFPSVMLNDNLNSVIRSSEQHLQPQMRQHGLKLAITQDRLERGVMKLIFIEGRLNRADMMTKNEEAPLFEDNRAALMAEADV